MFLRRAFVEGRRSAPRLIAYPSRLLHAPPLVTLKERTSTSQPPVHYKASHVATQAIQDTRPSRFQDDVDRFYEALTAHPEHGIAKLPQVHDFMEAFVAPSGSVSDIVESHQEKFCECIVLLAQNHSIASDKVLDSAVLAVSRVFPNKEDEYAERITLRLMYSRNVRATSRWLTALQRTQLECVTYGKTRGAWYAFLELLAELRDIKAIHNTLGFMRSAGILPTRETSAVIFEAIFRRRPQPNSPNYRYLSPPFPVIKHLINTLDALRVPYDEDSVKTLVDGYTRDGRPYLADEAEYYYVSTLAPRGNLDHDRVNDILASIALRGSRDSTTRIYRRFKTAGFTPSEDTFLAVLSGSTQISDLSHWQRVLQIKATPAVIEKLMELRAKSSAPALELYTYAKDRYIPLTAPMLHYTLRSLLTSFGLQKPTEQAIEAALELYQDFIDSKSRQVQDPHPTPATYQLLLRALTTSNNTTKYLPATVSVIEAMSRFGIALNYQTATSTLILLMRVSPSPEEAFRMYTLVGRPKPDSTEPVLDEDGYAAILHTFCTLPTWPDGIPSAALYFEIIADMRKYDVPIGPKVYTVLLAQLGKLATTANASNDTAQCEAIAKMITRIHNHLTVNSSFTPDTALYNQLMDSYQRAGHFTEACRIWQLLYASSQFNNASVSIILDGCAYAQAYDMAVRVYDMLNEAGYPLNVKNWNTYVECLCRLGRLDEAMKVVCLEMPRGRDGVEPDKESVRILMKFAAKMNQAAEVRNRIKRFLPTLYASVPDIMNGSS